jgi:hypothetical protein
LGEGNKRARQAGKGKRKGGGGSGYFLLHIGKTGGTYLSHILNKKVSVGKGKIRRLGHKLTLPKGLEKFPARPAVFTVREPLSLFVSAFNSRLRKGQPRYYVEWSREEAIAFELFPTPNDLGEALSSPDPFKRACAEFAMLQIKHVKRGLKWYLGSAELLELNRDRIGFILSQSQLEADVRDFVKKLGLDAEQLDLGADEVTKHATPKQYSRDLSELASANLSRWYEDDIKIYEWCLNNKAAINGGLAQAA